MPDPQIALLMSTYQRPWHLRMALASIALQQGVDGLIQLVVTDDGSVDETREIVNEFSKRANFPVTFTSHPHTTFCLAKCRNEGVAASRAPYLLFLDGDCVLPPDHVRTHLERRRPGVVMAGDCCRLEKEVSQRMTEEAIRAVEFANWATISERKRLIKLDWSSRYYRLVRHATKPKLIGNNVGIWRADYERVNGYDENFQGWGCEDDDLRYRLRRTGVQIESILRWTRTYHLWHPTDQTAPATWRQGANVQYLLRKGRLTRCRNGLVKRSLNDLSLRVIPGGAPYDQARLLGGRVCSAPPAKPEVEILFLPGPGDFSGEAECNILVVLAETQRATLMARHAQLIVSSQRMEAPPGVLQFPADAFQQALDAVA